MGNVYGYVRVSSIDQNEDRQLIVIPEDVADDESELVEDDLSEDIPEDVPEDQDENTSDNDEAVTDEVAEETTSETEDTDSAEQTEDTQDEQTDETATDEVAEETTSETEDTDSTELTEDTQDEQMDDSTTEESNELPTEQYDAPLDDVVINETMNNDASQDEQADGYDDSNTLESRITDDAVSDTDEKSAMDRMSDYMNSHNYGLDDKDTYMSDPEWISINRDLKAELGIPQTAQEQMMDYNGTYIDFLNSVDQYIDTHPRDPNYDSRRDTVFNWISNLKAKRRIN